MNTSQFLAEEGIGDWRMLFDGAYTCFRTGSLAAGAALVAAIAAVDGAEAADLDLRARTVTVRLPVIDFSLPDSHPDLARRISAAAASLGVPADPTAAQVVQVSIDALVGEKVMPFWAAVLGYDQAGEEDVLDPQRRGPGFWFQVMDAPRPQRNRIHVDVCVPPEVAQARVAAGLAAGGTLLRDNAPTHWGLADPEGNEVDIATMLGRD